MGGKIQPYKDLRHGLPLRGRSHKRRHQNRRGNKGYRNLNKRIKEWKLHIDQGIIKKRS